MCGGACFVGDSWQVEDEIILVPCVLIDTKTGMLRGTMEEGETSPGLGSLGQFLWDVLSTGLIFREEGVH